MGRVNKGLVPLVPAEGLADSSESRPPEYEAERVTVRHSMRNLPPAIIRVSTLNGTAPVFAAYDRGKKEIQLFTSADKITWGKDMSRAFEGLSRLESIDGTCFDTSKVTDMTRAFAGVVRLREMDTSGWDLNRVQRLDEAFLHCGALRLIDLSGSPMTSIQSASRAFADCYNLEELRLAPSGRSTYIGRVVAMLERSPDMLENCKSLSLSGPETPEADEVDHCRVYDDCGMR